MSDAAHGAHDDHLGLPGYDERQIYKDGCGTCEARGGDFEEALVHMDGQTFGRAWRRAYQWQHNGGDLAISKAEAPMLRHLWTVQVMLERCCGVPLGELPLPRWGKPTDAWADPSAVAWVEHVLVDMVPKMEQSAMVINLVPPEGKHSAGDVKFWVELGASIMMEKPILAVAFDGRQVPEKLRAIADKVVILPGGVSPESSEELAGAIAEFVKGTRP
jgi:hypothetical protein